MIDIIIVNWNAGAQLDGSVSSIIHCHHGLVSSVIVVDNNSTDDSLERLSALANTPFPIHIIRNTENRGFGAACNQGVAVSKADYLLFLNPDTRLFDNSLTVPASFMQQPEHADVGVVGIQLVDEQKRISKSCARFPTLSIFAAQILGISTFPRFRHLDLHMKEWEHNQTVEVAHVIGAFYLMRRSLFISLGGFDERFFVYLEDLDLSLRTHLAGMRVIYLADVQAFHAEGGVSRQVKAHRLFYSLRSRLMYGFKHFKPWQAWSLLVLTLLLEPVSRVARAIARSGVQEVCDTLKGYGMLFHDLPNILKQLEQR